MALGVLNNLSAIYAEHNLNNTSNSLQTVLRQLSSGSRISSGADDAAGSSLVNGLQANSTALSQSVTNATEGVGLLQVADGALSQVTNLLNRAITLATEASNGTLNANQAAAANQEYQSILAEINNIGSTTTYNQQPVFSDRTVSIYTGDSSTSGSSIDNIYIRSLSAGNVGDSNGRITYSNGQNNVFINLSKAGKNAAVTDSLGAPTATTIINVSYIIKGANGSAVASTAQISAGAGTNYPNTAQGLIDAINNSGLGVNASFTTAAAAGSAAVAAAAVAEGGAGSPSDTGIAIAASGIGTGSAGVGVVGALALTPGNSLGGTLTIVGADGTSHNITLGTFNSTDTLSNLQSTINAAGYGVTASINQAGTQLTFTTANPRVIVSGTSLTDIAPAVPTTTIITGSDLGSLAVNGAGDLLSGTLNIVEGSDALATASQLVLGAQGTTDTLANLMATINSNPAYGITASTNLAAIGTLGQPGYQAIGTVLTFTKTSTDAGTPSVTGLLLKDQVAVNVAPGATLGSITVRNVGDTLAGSLTGTNNAGGTYTIPLGLSGTTDTITNLRNTFNNTYAALGITATISNGTTLTFTRTTGDTGSPTVTGNVAARSNTSFVAGAGRNTGTMAIGAAGDILSGTLTGTADDGTTPISVGLGASGSTDTVTNLLTYFNTTHGAWGISAAYSAGVLSFTSATGTAALSGANLTDTDPPAKTVVSGTLLDTVTVNAPADVLSGTLSVTSAVDGSVHPITLGTAGVTDTLAHLVTAITSGGYGLTATVNGSATGTLGQPGYHAAGTVLTISEDAQYLGNGNAASVTSAQPLGDAVVAGLVPGTNLGKLTVGNTADTLTGTLKGVKGDVSATPYQIDLIGQTLPQLAAIINTDPTYGITATLNQAGNALTFTATPGALGKPTLFNVGNITTTLPAIPASIALTEVPTPGAANSTQLGSMAITSADTLSGSLVIGAHTISIGLSNNSGATLADAINNGDYGVHATYDSIAGTMAFISANSAMVVDPNLLRQTPAGGAPGAVTFTASGITSSDYYSVGIRGIVADSSTLGGTANVGITTDSNGLGGVATTSYSDGPGVNLSTTDLTTQVQAQSALNSINLAVTAAAALDGYIGGQINMLNSVSQVLTTQQENVTSAQNAIQATDYASAAANLSKYQILSQTGIAALAQANSIQQEVTKLLQ